MTENYKKILYKVLLSLKTEEEVSNYILLQ